MSTLISRPAMFLAVMIASAGCAEPMWLGPCADPPRAIGADVLPAPSDGAREEARQARPARDAGPSASRHLAPPPLGAADEGPVSLLAQMESGRKERRDEWRRTCTSLGGHLEGDRTYPACVGLALPDVDWAAFPSQPELSCIASGGRWTRGNVGAGRPCVQLLRSDIAVNMVSAGCRCKPAMCTVGPKGGRRVACVNKPAWYLQLQNVLSDGPASASGSAESDEERKATNDLKKGPVRPVISPKKGAVPASEIERAWREIARRVRGCEEYANRKRETSLSGTVGFKMLVLKDGSLSSLKLEHANEDDQELLRCLHVSARRGARFERLSTGDYALVKRSYRFGQK